MLIIRAWRGLVFGHISSFPRLGGPDPCDSAFADALGLVGQLGDEKTLGAEGLQSG
jgi:hypothetical protein